MPNPTITNLDYAPLVFSDAETSGEELTFGGAGTVVEGTILARDSVSLKLVPYVIGGSTNENGIPKAVAVSDVTATGAGDVAMTALVGGKLNFNKLVVDADGDNSNITDAILDQLRDYGLVTRSATELLVQDNQ